jgi:hypothetical protein
MPDGIITMTDMETIFSVTDAFGIHRESVRVELVKEDPGAVDRNATGTIEIIVPESEGIEAFAERLQVELEAMGYAPSSPGEDDDEEEGDWLGS